MSSKSPQFSDFYQTLAVGFSVLEQDVDQYLPQSESKTSLLSGIERLNFQYRSIRNDPDQASKQIDEIARKAEEILQNLEREVERQTSNDRAIIFDDLATLKNHCSRYQNIVKNYQKIEQIGLMQLAKSDDWAEEELLALATNKNEWALKCIKEGMDRKETSSFQLLTQYITKTEDVAPFEDYILHPQFTALFNLQNIDNIGSNIKALPIILLNRFSPVIFEQFTQLIANNNLAACVEFESFFIQKDSIFTNTDEFKIYENFLLENLLKGHEWAIKTLYLYLESDDSESSTASAFLNDVVQRAKSEPLLIEVLTTLSSLLYDHEVLENHLKTTLKESSCSLSNAVSCEFMRDFIDEMLANLIELATDETPECLEWGDLRLEEQIKFTRLYYKRSVALCDFFLNALKLSKAQDRPICDSFPQAKKVLLGHVLDSEGKLKNLPIDLAQILHGYDIELMTTLPCGAAVEQVSHLKCKRSFHPLIKWIRDAMFVRSGGVMLPTILDKDDNDLYFMTLEGYLRMNPEKTEDESKKSNEKTASAVASLPEDNESSKRKRPFVSMGNVAQTFAQIQFLSTLDFSIDQCGFQFTYNEGGNCLFGQFNNEPYVIVGRDAIELNKIALARQLADLGICKTDNDWKAGQRYDPGDCELTDQDIVFVLARDYGIDFERVHVVEQPDFHIDMKITLLPQRPGDTKPRLLINSSQLSLKVLHNLRNINAKTYQENKENNDIKWEKWAAKCAKVQPYEDQCAKDLENKGFEVIKIAGCFENFLEKAPMMSRCNFFNHVSLTSPSGKRIILAADCDKFFKEIFLEIVKDEMGSDIEVHFLDRRSCEALLSQEGSLHCVTQVFEN